MSGSARERFNGSDSTGISRKAFFEQGAEWNMREVIAATNIQQTMVLATLRGGPAPLYQIQTVLHFTSGVDLPRLKSAWTCLLQRHAILQSLFRFDGTQLMIEPVHSFSLDWLEEPVGTFTDSRESVWRGVLERLDEEYQHPLSLFAGHPAWRIRVLWLPDRTAIWSCLRHHAITDFLSDGRIIAELFGFYEAIETIPESELLKTLVPAPDFDEYLRWHHGQPWDKLAEFWKSRLEGIGDPTPLATVYSPLASKTERLTQQRQDVTLSPDLSYALQMLAITERISPNVLLIAAWALWLARSVDEDRVIFGILRSLRRAPIPGIDTMVGPLLNSLPMVLSLNGNGSIREWLHLIQEEWRNFRNSEHCPLSVIRQWSGIEIGTPLFRTAVNFQTQKFELASLKWGFQNHARMIYNRQLTDLPLTISGWAEPSFGCALIYWPDQVSWPYIQQVAAALPLLLSQLVCRIDRPLCEVSLVDSSDVNALRVGEGSVRTFLPNLAAHQLIERVAKYDPEAIALSSSVDQITYGVLNSRAGAVAQRLLNLGILPGQVVGVHLAAHPDLVVILLGILKAGAAFFVMSPELPSDLIDQQLAGAGAVILVESDSQNKALGTAVPRLDIQQILLPSPPTISIPANEQSLAYIVSTSGSTGSPKFIRILHRALGNYLSAIVDYHRLQSADRRLQSATPGSDYFVSEIFSNLVAGAAIVFPDKSGPLGISEYLDRLEKHRITVTGIPSSYWHEWVSLLNQSRMNFPKTLRLVIAGMERVEVESLRRWKQLVPARVRFVNVYGPSEATCVTTAYDASAVIPTEWTQVPIGRPLTNMAVYVLDSALRALPLGMVGELYISGLGLMDSDSLIANPHATNEVFSQLYQSGDFGYFLPDGQLVFVGRHDQQVKVRGHRLELATIESAVADAASASNAAVILIQHDGGSSLWGFVETAQKIEEKEVKVQLARALIPAMIPARIEFRVALPRLSGGKIDRKKLVREMQTMLETTSSGQPSKTDSRHHSLEARLVAIFRRSLHREDLSADDDIFSAGADSLVCIRAVARLEEETGLVIPLQLLYKHHTIRGACQEHDVGRPSALSALDTLPAPLDCEFVTLLNRSMDLWPGAAARSGFPFRVLPGSRPEMGPLVLFAPDHESAGSLAPIWSRYRPIHLYSSWYQAVRTFEQVQGLARFYAPSVLNSAHGCPAIVVGYCVGAMVAYEVARELSRMAYPPRLLVLIERPGPAMPYRVWSHLKRQVRLVTTKTQDTAVGINSIVEGDRRVHPERLETGQPAPRLWSSADLLTGSMPYSGRALVVVARSSDIHSRLIPHLGWQGQLTGRWSVLTISGTHFSSVRDSASVQQLVQGVESELRR